MALMIIFGFIALASDIFVNKSSSLLFKGDSVPFGIDVVNADVSTGGGEGSGGEGSCGEGSGGEGSCEGSQ